MRAYRPPDRDKYLMGPEIVRLLNGAKKVLRERSYMMLLFAAHTGARPSETLAVEPSDFRWREGGCRIRTLKQKVDPKTGQQRVIHRDVDLSEDAVKELKPWVQKQSSGRPLFPYSRVWSWKAFKKAAAAGGLRGAYTQYSLRHSRAIFLLQVTEEDYKYVQQQLGHSDVNVTMVYAHVLPEKRKEYRAKMKGFG